MHKVLKIFSKNFIILAITSGVAVAMVIFATNNYKQVLGIFSSGGGRSATNTYSTYGTIGQGVAGIAKSSNYKNSAGYSYQVEASIAGAPSVNLTDAYVYPNPYKPGTGGNYDNPVRPGGGESEGVIFNKLTQQCNIKIFDISGQLVFDDEKNDSQGYYVWNTKNKEGSKVASGVYIYLITNDAGERKSGKFAIIR